MSMPAGAKSQRTRKHHYLPRHYLAGFVDANNCFFIYDKLDDRLLSSPLTPDAAFFENNLNTVSFPNGESSDFMENLYTIIENKSWDSLDNIRRSTNRTKIAVFDEMHLFFFLSFLHWRLPANINYVEELSKGFFVEDNSLSFLRLKTANGENAPKEIRELMRNSPAFKKSAKLMIPFAPFFDASWSGRIEKWRFLYTGDSKNWYIVGDNPIITKGDNDHDPVNCLNEFAFPVSGRILLINTDKPIKKFMLPEHVVRVGLSIIQKAQRFIACQNLSFLAALVGFYRQYVKSNKTDTIIGEMFDMFQ